MSKYDGYLICTDLDGTFIRNHELCGENAKYVKYFQDNGGLFTVSTGRLPDYFREFENFSPNCPVVTHNGACIYDLEKDEIIFEKPLANECYEVAEYAYESGKTTAVYMNEIHSAWLYPNDAEASRNSEILKLVICVETADEAVRLRDELKEKFGDNYCIFLAWNTGIEVLAKDTNKGTAVEKLRNILGDRIKKVICVGDSESDSFMMRTADIGYAVENADDAARKAADRITVDFNDGFVKYIIEDIEKELLKK